MFTTAINWFKNNIVGRSTHFEAFLNDVIRLPQLSPIFLSDVVLCHPLLKAWDVVKLERLICEALAYHVTGFKDRLVASGELRFSKRKGHATNGAVQYVCNYRLYFQKTRLLSIGSPLEITTYEDLNQKRYYHEFSVLNGKVYVFGGTMNHEYFSSIEVLDNQTRKWQTMSSTTITRRREPTAIGKSNSIIFVIILFIDFDHSMR